GATKNLAKALGFFGRAAVQGDADAHGDLGEMYLKGEGRAVDYTLALKHLSVAATQGLAKAQFQLGELYRDGRGTARDLKSARHWFEKSANNNNANAAFSLSAMYLGGELKARDGITRAYSWFVRGLRAQGLNPSVLIHQKLRPMTQG
ncbi:MAG: sel1 repeat family protein, partial [Rhodospirillales bacterium]|nr:sel1 repeat family protein [Rhodospirillales bacterium]